MSQDFMPWIVQMDGSIFLGVLHVGPLHWPPQRSLQWFRGSVVTQKFCHQGAVFQLYAEHPHAPDALSVWLPHARCGDLLGGLFLGIQIAIDNVDSGKASFAGHVLACLTKTIVQPSLSHTVPKEGHPATCDILQATKIPTLALAMDEPQLCIQKHMDNRVEVATSNGLLLLVVRGSVPRSRFDTSDDLQSCWVCNLHDFSTVGGRRYTKFEISTDKLSQTKPFCSVLDS